MIKYANLEIGLHHRESEWYAIEFRFSQPDSDADIYFGQDQPTFIQFDFRALNSLSYDPLVYGQTLTNSLFSEPPARAAFAQALASAESQDLPMRVRLYIGPSAPELHNLHWETLCNPLDGLAISTSENLIFSRYLGSQDWRPIRLRPKRELQALVVVANPLNLVDYNLTPVDIEGELNRVRKALGNITISSIPDPNKDEHATIANIIARLRESEADILYLVCHGTHTMNESWLWLENNDGNVARTSGTELTARLKELQRRPQLVILASCQSAGKGQGEALTALGPLLAASGVPAVVAMQGIISMKTIEEFMPVFFRELQRDGQIDRALAVARGEIRNRPDYWMPALFLRLRSGRIWYVPGFGDEREEFQKWHSLVGFIHEEFCTPILGPGLWEPVVGSRRDIALKWAEKHAYPLSPHDKDDLPRVAQYLVTHQAPAYLPVALREAVQDEILRRYDKYMPDDLREAPAWSTAMLLQALDLAATKCWSDPASDPYKLLANLRLPIYITTSPGDLISHTLLEAGIEPTVRICPWNKWIPKEKAVYEEIPTPEKPLVYHLYGHFSIPDSIVLTEDMYFDYLIGVTRNRSLIPSAVRAALTNSSLLLLGFQIDDWEFRVFFRFLIAQEGRERLKLFSHASAQIEPEEDRIMDVNRAHKYLEEYFESENISIYWGSAEEFLISLWRHMHSKDDNTK